MPVINRSFLLVALSLCPLFGNYVDESTRQSKPEFGLPAGTYGGCNQKMVIGSDGTVSYKDQLHLTQIRIETDGSLDATFPSEAGSNEVIHLQPLESEATRAVWIASANGRTYQATAIPHSEETHSFRLEVRRDGKLVGGTQVFCAICKSSVKPQK